MMHIARMTQITNRSVIIIIIIIIRRTCEQKDRIVVVYTARCIALCANKTAEN